MRKWIFLGLGIMFLSGSVHAAQLQPQFRTWKASYTETADLNVVLATAPIILHGIIVSSPTVNSGASGIYFYNSTGSVLTIFTTTRTSANLDSTVILTPSDHTWDIVFSSITMYSKQGLSKLTILYDYLIAPSMTNLDNR